MRDFRKYEVWQIAHILVLDIYKQTINFPKSEHYGIVSQLNRAEVSIPTNISEGVEDNLMQNFIGFFKLH